MQKLIALVRRADARDREAFLHVACAEAQQRMAHLPDLAALTVNLVDVAPAAGAPAAEPPYDAALELWLEDVDRLPDALAVLARGDGGRWPVDAYHVAERVQLDHDRIWPLGERSPGIKLIYLVRRPEGLEAREAGRLWRQHAPLAREHHVGMSRYVQNGVLAPLTPGAPVVHGIAMLHFPTRADLEQRMYGSAAGRAAIAADAARLVGEATALYTSEYVLRG